jgi:protein phosphatase 1 regulatory subunit 7
VQNKISTIENLDGLSKLRNLELAANRIREIQNLESLTGLEELWLGKNKITEIRGLDTLQNLKILSIQSNRIRSISGLDALPQLEELYISHNALTTLSGLENTKALRVLDISNNKIEKLEGVGHLEEIEELWASYNLFEDFAEVERELGGKKALTTVYFEGCPLQLRGPAVYRNKVRLALPQVLQIDASEWRLLPFCSYSPLFLFFYGLGFRGFGKWLTFVQLLSGSHDSIDRDCKIAWLALKIKLMSMRKSWMDGSSMELRHGQSLRSHCRRRTISA